MPPSVTDLKFSFETLQGRKGEFYAWPTQANRMPVIARTRDRAIYTLMRLLPSREDILNDVAVLGYIRTALYVALDEKDRTLERFYTPHGS
jgi:hypothetical protein